MSIEFRCPQCQRLLRVPEGSQGKQAQCPQCQAMVQVPAASAPPVPAPAPPPGPASPFGANFPAAPPRSDNPYQAPTAAMGAPQFGTGAGVLPLVPSKMDLGDVLNRTWEIFKSQMGMLILITFAVGAINWGASMISSVILQAINAAVNDAAVLVALQGVFQIVLGVFQIWLGLGQLRFMLKIARGQPAEFTDIFTGSPYLLPALAASIVVGLAMLALALPFLGPSGLVYLATNNQETALIALGLGMVIYLPVIIFVTLSISQFQALIVDRNLGAIDSLKTSNEIMSGNRLMLFVLGLLLGIINLLGCAACFVGLFFTASYSALATSVAYLVMTGQPTADQLMRGAPPPVMPPPQV